MGLHRFIFDLPQISLWLNQNKLESEKVTPEELKKWAEAGCFPYEKKGDMYRITEDVLPAIEETKHLIKTEEYSIEEAKAILQKAFHEKERYFERMEKLDVPPTETLLLLNAFHEETNETIQVATNGVIMGLVDTESALKDAHEETIREAEERIKGAVIHAEVRMKTVMERVEQRMMKQMQDLLHPTTQDDIEQLIQKHQETLLGLAQDAEENLQKVNEAHEKEREELKKYHATHYEELVQAGFFKRRQLKKAWKEKK